MSKRETEQNEHMEGWAKHSMQYVRSNTFHVLCFTFCILLSLSQVSAQTQESSDTQLESDLPDEVIAEIIDTTRIVLEPRSRFSDPLVPQLIHAIALYPKERLWNLPPTTTPQKAVKPTDPPPKNYSFHLNAYPSLPESLIYQVLFAGHTKQTYGFLHLNRQQLGNARTKERGDYNLDGIRGGLSHEYQELSKISLDFGLNLKALEWFPATEGDPNPQKDLSLFRSDLNWQQQISETTWSTLNLDTTLLRIDHDGSEPRDEVADLRLNFDMALSWPFLNPIHAGGNVEYFSAGDAEEIIARLYARDEFSPFGPFVLSIGLEGVSFREHDDTVEDRADAQFDMVDTPQQPDAETGEGEADPQLNMADTPQEADIETGEDKTDSQLNMTDTSEQTDVETGADKLNLPLYPSLALTTHLDKHWLIRLEGSRTIARHRLSTLYFDTDYISFNPRLRPEKAWNGKITLKYHRGAKFEVNLSGFAKQTDDLVILMTLKEHLENIGVQPINIDASIYGGQLLISARIVDRLDLRFQYTHELHDTAGISETNTDPRIPYRAADRIDMDAVYHLPSEFHVALKAELRGPRYVDMTPGDPLKSYLLLQPKLSKTIGNFDVFVGGAFAIGEYRLLELYELSQRNFDFGIELKF
ncbi:TonB-dependent receptor [Candidatus Poribacteria bacterium]|nr:TonB-dependent receptor [Candidatus Poribacteria bacterium]